MADSVRYWRRHPRFAAAAIFLFALGFASVTAAWSLLETAVLRPLPFGDSSRLIDITQLRAADHVSRMPGATVPLAAFDQWRGATASIEDLAAYAYHDALLATSGDATQREALAVSSNFFRILGVAPMLGGGFDSSDDTRGAAARIILSYGLWKSAFGGNPEIVGTSIQIDGDIATVAGVMPDGFEYPSGAELWRSIGESLRDRRLPRSTVPIYSLVGRLRHGATLAQAERDLIAVAEQRWNVAPELRGWLPVLRTLEEATVGDSRRPLFIVLSASLLLLLIACANVGNLLLARSLSREREFEVRRVLGASRRGILRQIALEAAVLIAGGLALGAVMAFWFYKALRAAGESLLGREILTTPSALVVSVAVAIISLIAFLTALAPQYLARRGNGPVYLRAGAHLTSTRAHGSAQRTAQVFQLSLTMFVLVVAGLLALSYSRLRALDLGFSADRMLVLTLRPPTHLYPGSLSRGQLAARIRERLGAERGVSDVALASGTPFDWADFTSAGSDSAESEQEMVFLSNISPRYFAASGIPILTGRDFHQGEDSLSVILNRKAAEALFRTRSAVGREIVLYGSRRRVVGVVGNTYQESLRSGERPHIYTPIGRTARPTFHVIIGSRQDPVSLTPRIRELLREIDPSLPITRISTGSALVASSVRTDRVLTLLLGATSAAILLITVFGVYASTAQYIERRRRSLAIRKALGQDEMGAFVATIRGAMSPAVLAAIIGGGTAATAGRVLNANLYGTTALSWQAYVSAGLVLAACVALAAVPSALRAAHANPAEALKAE